MKKLVGITLTICLTITQMVSVFAQTPKVLINNSPLEFTDAQPIIENDRTLVPMRAIFEALDAVVTWDPDTQTIYASKTINTDTTVIALQIDSNTAFLKKQGEDTKTLTLDVPAKIKDDRTYVPLRFIAESLEKNVDWDEANCTVLID